MIYPWGNDWRENDANTAEYWQKPRTRSVWARLRREKSNATTTPIGYFSPRGDSPYGCADMSGNVWEWTRSVYKEYPYNANDGREDEGASERRVLRGGSFDYYRSYARCAFRFIYSPGDRNLNFGFRVCVSSPSYI